jgi:hypothetical protein
MSFCPSLNWSDIHYPLRQTTFTSLGLPPLYYLTLFPSHLKAPGRRSDPLLELFTILLHGLRRTRAPET